MNASAELEKLRYPIGRFKLSHPVTDEDISSFINEIELLPKRISGAVEGLNDEKLDTPYREEGWTVRQVVHHVADSHINSYVRFKWTVTENRPMIKAYFEERWATTGDAIAAPVSLSLNLLTALHNRWVYFLKSLSAKELEQEFIHPETGKAISLRKSIALYAWHGNHHLAHISHLKDRKGW